MVGDGNVRKAKTTTISQHRMPDYKDVPKFLFKTPGVCANILLLVLTPLISLISNNAFIILKLSKLLRNILIKVTLVLTKVE